MTQTLPQLRSAIRNGVQFLLPSHAVLRVLGRDHIRYLHNRLSQEVKKLAVGEGRHSLLLTPNGRLQGVLFLIREAESVVMLCGPFASDSERAEFVTALLQFKVADHIEVADLSTEHIGVLSIGAEDSAAGVAFPFGAFGARLSIVPRSEIPTSAQDWSVTPDSLSNAVRVVAGFPTFGIDVSEKSLGPDIDPEHFVSFTKGCYTGQEVMEMAVARGKLNKRLCLVISDGVLPISVPADVQLDGKTIGTATSIISLAPSGPTLALATLKADALNAPAVLIGGELFAPTSPAALLERLLA